MSEDTDSLSSNETLNERLFQEEPIIAGRKVRPWNNAVKLKLARIVNWVNSENRSDQTGQTGLTDQTTQIEEILYGFLYLVAAPIERVAINTLNKKAYFIDKDEFIGSLSEEEVVLGGKWFLNATSLEKETSVEIFSKPTASSGETPPPNS